ncbi:MAG TPA: PilZ domain-containing protein [Terriglobales bacterium]|nr:PilZ domain-containing protein [Terriglobales bacterium]
MNLQALLVSKDDDAAEVLGRLLAEFNVGVERSSDPEIAVSRLEEERFDAVIVDFEEPEAARQVLTAVRQPGSKSGAVTLALVIDPAHIRNTFGAGANFVLTKPLSPEKTTAALRSAAALLKRERRRSFRVPVQTPVAISAPGGLELEGIMLDLSATGMDVLSAQPLAQSALIGFRFELPDASVKVEAHGEVAWASPNGQTGVRFLDLPEDVQASVQNWLVAHSSEAPPEEADPVAHCKLTDLSLGGCYVETESPFPEGAAVDLCLKAEDMEIHLEGLVRVMHPETGIGIEFPSRTEDQRERVGKFIEFLTSRPGTVPDLLISPRSLVANEAEFADEETDLNDPLLDLLRHGRSVTPEEFFAELRKQRNSQEVASS